MRKFFMLGFLLYSSYAFSLGYKVHVKDALIEIYFSPKGGAEDRIVSLIKGAKKSVYIACYSITSRKIARAIETAHKNGVEIKIIMDSAQSKIKHSKFNFFRKRGIEVIRDKVRGLMHNKFAVIDESIVITGSFNWTKNAEEKNAENMLVIHDRDVAKIFLLEFFRLYRINK